MLTIRDLGRGIAKLLLECLHDFRKGRMRRVQLLKRKILAIGRSTADLFVDTAVQL
jgi:hypothetical protein